jgi:type VII secretion protein EccB
MATTRELAEAADYESRRQSTSLMTGEDEARRDPRRRVNRITVAGAFVGILAMAGFGIAGFLGAGRGPALPQSGAVLVAGSGDRYVIVDGRLHPALNLASALLVGGGELTEVRPDVLDALPRGLPVGIPEAPDALPRPERLTTADWSVCTVPAAAPTLPPQVTLRVGVAEPTEGVLTAAQALVVRADDGALWLLDQGVRHRLDGPTPVLLDIQRTAPVGLPPAVLDTVPAGSVVGVPVVDGVGEPAAGTAWLVGDVVRVGETLRGAYVVQPGGLSPVSEFTATLLVNAGAPVRQAMSAQVGRLAGRPAHAGRPAVQPPGLLLHHPGPATHGCPAERVTRTGRSWDPARSAVGRSSVSALDLGGIHRDAPRRARTADEKSTHDHWLRRPRPGPCHAPPGTRPRYRRQARHGRAQLPRPGGPGLRLHPHPDARPGRGRAAGLGVGAVLAGRRARRRLLPALRVRGDRRLPPLLHPSRLHGPQGAPQRARDRGQSRDAG